MPGVRLTELPLTFCTGTPATQPWGEDERGDVLLDCTAHAGVSQTGA